MAALVRMSATLCDTSGIRFILEERASQALCFCGHVLPVETNQRLPAGF
jgi:hypothetical protein